MTAPSDLIRRGDAEAAIEAAKMDFQDPEDGLRAAGDALRALPADPVAEADDDVVLRADVFAALDKRMEREEYGHARTAVALDIEAVGRIPKRKVRVDPVAKAERKVARAMLAWYGISRLSVSAEEYRAVEAEGAAAIEELRAAVAARSAGTVPPAPAPVRPPAVRVPTPEEIAAMPLEQVAAETARLKRETGAVGGISRCEPAPACARCGGSGRDSRAECRPVFDAASSRWVPEVIPCPECRGKP